MNINNFLNEENISTLWDVISDEENFKFLSRDIQGKVADIFSKNIKGFYEAERNKTNNLIDLNKKFILLILNHIKQKYPYKPNKIKIYDEQPIKDCITAEEIQNDRKTKFEQDLQQRQQEFENSMTIKAPEVPVFADKYNDTPISEMDKIIKEMTSKRNYDVELINRNYNSDINQVNNWLKPQETSLKSEKFTPQMINDEKTQTYNNLKYLNLENNNDDNINNILSITKKNVTWSENKDMHDTDEIEETIFNKLKKIKKEEINENISISFQDTYENTSNYDTLNEDRIIKLENEIKKVNNKIDKILTILMQNT